MQGSGISPWRRKAAGIKVLSVAESSFAGNRPEQAGGDCFQMTPGRCDSELITVEKGFFKSRCNGNSCRLCQFKLHWPLSFSLNHYCLR